MTKTGIALRSILPVPGEPGLYEMAYADAFGREHRVRSGLCGAASAVRFEGASYIEVFFQVADAGRAEGSA